jgi:transposase
VIGWGWADSAWGDYMGKPYSQDLRERVIAAVDGGGRVYAIAPLFQVSVSYIYKVLGRRRTTGETTARWAGGAQAEACGTR